MKKLFTTLFLLMSLLSFSNDTSKTENQLVIFKVSYIHPIAVHYWGRLNNDSTFRSLYKLVMVKDTLDRLSIEDVKSGIEIGIIGGRPQLEFLINLYHRKFYSQEVIDDLTLISKL